MGGQRWNTVADAQWAWDERLERGLLSWQILASGSADRKVKIWEDLPHGKVGATLGHLTGGVADLDWSPDGRWLLACGGHGMRVWRMKGDLLHRSKSLEFEDGAVVAGAAWAPDKNISPT